MEFKPFDEISGEPRERWPKWLLACGHSATMTPAEIDKGAAGALGVPESPEYCPQCRRREVVTGSEPAIAFPGHDDRSVRDVLLLHKSETGWRWTRYGPLGQTIDVSEDFPHEAQAREDAVRRNHDVPLQRA